jgi:hypothetical protein
MEVLVWGCNSIQVEYLQMNCINNVIVLKTLLCMVNYIFAQVRLFSKSRRRSHGKNINYVFFLRTTSFWHDFRLYLRYYPVRYLCHSLIRMRCANRTSKLRKCSWHSLTRTASAVIVATCNEFTTNTLSMHTSFSQGLNPSPKKKKSAFYLITFISVAFSLTARHQ